MAENDNNKNCVGRIVKLSDTVALAEGIGYISMGSIVSVGDRKVSAEVVGVSRDAVTLCFLEDARGLGLGECVVMRDEAFTAELGPGLLGNIFDAIGRPMTPSADRGRLWYFDAALKFGDRIKGGEVYGAVKETRLVTHGITVPRGVSGSIVELRSGERNVTDRIGKIKRRDGTIEDITLMSRRQVLGHKAHPLCPRSDERLVTNIDAIDTSFPIDVGGSACVVGKKAGDSSLLLHTLAKKADADVVVYASCSPYSREVCGLFSELKDTKDKRHGVPLTERTVLITSRANMSAAAREKAAYLGATVAEYYRDMGHSVLLLLDGLTGLANAAREKAFDAGCEFYLYPVEISAQISGLLARAAGEVASANGRGSITVVASVDSTDRELLKVLEKSVGALWVLDDMSDGDAKLDGRTSYSKYAKKPFFRRL